MISAPIITPGNVASRRRVDRLDPRQTLGSDLLDGLVDFWPMNEPASTRLGVVAANNLTDNNAVGNADGNGAIAANFSSNKYLSVASNAVIQLGDFDFTYSGWYYFTSNPIGSFPVLMKKYSTPTAAQVYLYCESATPQMRWVCSPVANAAGAVGVYAATFGTQSAGAWHMCTVYHDSVNNLIGIAIDAGAADTAAFSAGVFATGTDPLVFGYDNNAASGNLGGRLQRWGLWKRMLTANERTYLYNGGRGRDYPFV